MCSFSFSVPCWDCAHVVQLEIGIAGNMTGREQIASLHCSRGFNLFMALGVSTEKSERAQAACVC